MNRSLLLAALLLVSSARLEPEELTSADLESASAFVRDAATALASGSLRHLPSAIDLDGILMRRIPQAVWKRLSDRQRERLRSLVRDSFEEALVPARARGEVAWLVPEKAGHAPRVHVALRFSGRVTKTRWDLRRSGAGWLVEDVVVSDPGFSLAAAALDALGASPVQSGTPGREAAREALPRVLGVLAITLVVLVGLRRIDADKRVLLLLTASAPAFLFAADGILAVRRTLSEPFRLDEALPHRPWQNAARRAAEAERRGDVAAAEAERRRAEAAGAPKGALAYELGLEARTRGDMARSGRLFEEALDSRPPAPGAARELASRALAGGDSGRARSLLEDYVREAGPDPDSLSALAVARTNVGDGSGAVAAIGDARDLSGGTRGADVEARVRARAGDAAGAVAALRRLETSGALDRYALRADPAYLPIAADPAWVAFLSERTPAPSPSAAVTPGPAPRLGARPSPTTP